ncbi:phage portal protein [Spartinivicinus ruber]|uniref:phage portal protein n=1 Tax=Spartinivicinus ruber TaxID=2683272 RepID=UPI0013CFB4DF|nr:phage portal protein [Spartinivicinus ruber]
MKTSPILGPNGERIVVVNRSYEGATRGPRSVGWYAPSSGPNRALVGSLPTLRNRTRAGYRNSLMQRAAINKNTCNEIGTGIQVCSNCEDDDFRLAANKLWGISVSEMDPESVLDFYGQQAQMARNRRLSGEVFIRLRRRKTNSGLAVPIQIDVLEADFVPIEFSKTLPNGNRIVHGVEFRGAYRVAYWLYKQHPQDGDSGDLTNLIRVPAKDIIHHYLPIRPKQVRGEPDSVVALLKDRTFADYDDTELIRKKERSAYTGFLYREEAFEEDYQFDPMSGKPLMEEGDIEEMEPVQRIAAGTMLRGVPGEKLELFDGDNSGQGYADFMRWQALQLATGMGLPYQLLTGDWNNVNDRLVRGILNEYHREIEMMQDHLMVYQVCRRVWQWWMDTAVLTGKLTAQHYATNPKYYQTMEACPDAWRHLHPVQDIQARQAAIKSHLSNMDSEATELGYDIDDNMRRNAQAFKRWLSICQENGIEPEIAAAFFNNQSNTANNDVAEKV